MEGAKGVITYKWTDEPTPRFQPGEKRNAKDIARLAKYIDEYLQSVMLETYFEDRKLL